MTQQQQQEDILVKSTKCVSIHVRHGDKIIESKIYPFSDYLDALYSLNLTGRYTVFVMSDDPGVINTAKKISTPELEFRFLEVERLDKDTDAFKYFTDSPSKYGYELYSEIDIASDCEYFIGSLSSNIDRYIIELGNIKNRKDGSNFKYINIDGFEYVD
eukprot:gene3226-4038_t